MDTPRSVSPGLDAFHDADWQDGEDFQQGGFNCFLRFYPEKVMKRLWASCICLPRIFGSAGAGEALDRLYEHSSMITVTEAAAILGCSDSKIRKFIVLGAIVPKRQKSTVRRKRMRIPSEQIERLIHFFQHFGRARETRRLKPFSKVINRLKNQEPISIGPFSKYLQIEDAARVLHCSRSTIRRMIISGKIRTKRQSAHRWVIDKNSIVAFLARNQINSSH